MRVVSWNIELGRNLDRAAEELKTLGGLEGADVVLLQEMDDSGVRSLADALGMDYRYAAPADHPLTGRPFGNAILSSWPMGEVESVPLPHTAAVQGQLRAATVATVDVNGTTIVAYSVHLETVLLDLRRRAAQVRVLVADTEQRVDPHVVIGGDFNSASTRSLRRFTAALEQAGFDHVSDRDAVTFQRFGRSFALDHLYTRALRRVDGGVVGRATASDHQPIWADLEIP